MSFFGRFTLLAVLLASAGAAANAQDQPVLGRVLACRSVVAADARLACFDRETAALGGSVARHDIVVVDRAEAKATERARFGLRAPRPDPFAGTNGQPLASVAGTVASAALDGAGKWMITLADGSRWRQIDDYPLGRSPRAGQPVKITRAALGSFKMAIAGQAAIRVTRER